MKVCCHICAREHSALDAFCPFCGAETVIPGTIAPACSRRCSSCPHDSLLGCMLGHSEPDSFDTGDSPYPYTVYENNRRVEHSVQRSRHGAAFLAFFFGWTGVHCFYLGFFARGAAHLLLSVLTLGLGLIPSWIWGVCEGVALERGKIDTDGYGNPLDMT